MTSSEQDCIVCKKQTGLVLNAMEFIPIQDHSNNVLETPHVHD